MIITPEVVGRDLTAKIEKVMRENDLTWGEAVLFLLGEVVSPCQPLKGVA